MTDEALILRRVIDERREKAARLERELAEERVVIEALQARMSAVRGDPAPEETAPAVSESEMLNIAEAVQFLGVSKTYFYRLKNEGAFKVMRIGKTNRVFRSDLAEYLRRKRESVLTKNDLQARADALMLARACGNAPKRGRKRRVSNV